MTDESGEGRWGLLKRFFSVGGGRSSPQEADEEAAGSIDRYKAHVIGEGLQVNALALDDAHMRRFTERGAILPPLPFDSLCALLFTSNSLRQNIDAYVVNVESTGWRAEPTIDLWGAKASEHVKAQLILQSAVASEEPDEDADEDEGDDEPDDALVEKTLKKWRRIAAREKAKLRHFFDFAHPEDTFTKLRQKKRRDEELLGNAAWEFVKNAEGQYAIINHVPFVTMRLLPLDKQAIDQEVPFKSDDVTIEKADIRRRMRRYMQVQDGLTIFFKQFGDDRIMSAATGNFFETEEELRLHEPKARVATEILHFDVDAPNKVYGMPRWIGNLISVMGSRLSEEVNFLYFENKSVPPLAIIFSGGRISADSVSRLESFVKNHIRGKGNFHKVLIIEAEPEDGDSKNTGRAQIKIQPLTDAQQQDALFQRYDKNNMNKVGASFRLPGMLRGDITELNRATADIAERLAEAQVFQPLRDDFDAEINRKVLTRLGIRFWLFRTRSPIRRDPVTITENVVKLVQAGVLMPDEARLLLADILGREFDSRSDPFLTMPSKLAIAAIRAASRPNFDGGGLIPGLKGSGDLSTEDLETRGGKLPPEQGGRVKGPRGGQEEDERRMERLGITAKNVAIIREMMDSEEMATALVKIPRDVFKRLLAEDDYEPEVVVAE